MAVIEPGLKGAIFLHGRLIRSPARKEPSLMAQRAKGDARFSNSVIVFMFSNKLARWAERPGGR